LQDGVSVEGNTNTSLLNSRTRVN